MKKAFLSNEKDWFILLISVLIFFISIAIFMAFAIVIAIPVFGISFSEILNRIQDVSNPENIEIIKYFQILQTIGVFIIPSLFIGFLISRKPVQYLQFKRTLDIELAAMVVLIIICASPFINLLSYINQQMKFPEFLQGVENWMRDKENAAEEITVIFLNVTTLKGLLINILMIGILPAFGEEMAFRGIIQKQFVKITENKHLGVLIAAFIFSAIHFQFYGFIPRFVLGLFLGYIYIWTGNIWYPVIAHFINNTMAVIAYYYISINDISYDIDNLGATNDTLLYGIGSIIITVFLLILIYRKTVNQR